MFALIDNLVCLVMPEAALRQEIPVERISFIDAVRWLRTGNPERRSRNWSSCCTVPTATNPVSSNAGRNNLTARPNLASKSSKSCGARRRRFK